MKKIAIVRKCIKRLEICLETGDIELRDKMFRILGKILTLRFLKKNLKHFNDDLTAKIALWSLLDSQEKVDCLYDVCSADVKEKIDCVGGLEFESSESKILRKGF